jgi:hypothetical protein
LGDSEREPGRGAGEVPLKPHLLLEVREDAPDHQLCRGERVLAALVAGGACPVGGEQPCAGGGEPACVVAAPEALLGDDDLGRRAGEQVGSCSFSFAGTTV